MAGVKGRSGGHNRKSAKQHEIDGTFRTSRHKDNVDFGLEMVADCDAPECLQQRGREAWQAQIRTGQVATLHLEALESFCTAIDLAEAVYPQLQANPTDKNVRTSWRAYCDTMDNLGRQFGWTPATRIETE